MSCITHNDHHFNAGRLYRTSLLITTTQNLILRQVTIDKSDLTPVVNALLNAMLRAG